MSLRPARSSTRSSQPHSSFSDVKRGAGLQAENPSLLGGGALREVRARLGRLVSRVFVHLALDLADHAENDLAVLVLLERVEALRARVVAVLAAKDGAGVGHEAARPKFFRERSLAKKKRLVFLF